jgi:monoamine oxidase
LTNRIAVIGAGLAGLAAASELRRLRHDVTVYEARDRVGGRVWSETIAAAGGLHVIERGAEFVLNGYSTLRGYCAAHELALIDTGMSYYIRKPADRPGVTTNDMATLGRKAADAAAAGDGPRSVADVLDEIGVGGPAREALEARIEMSTAVRTDQVTAEETLEHVASFEPGPSWRISGGNQELPNAMARELGDRAHGVQWCQSPLVSFVHARDEEHLVIHRQPEENARDHDGQEAQQRVPLRSLDDDVEPTPLEDRDGCA